MHRNNQKQEVSRNYAGSDWEALARQIASLLVQAVQGIVMQAIAAYTATVPSVGPGIQAEIGHPNAREIDRFVPLKEAAKLFGKHTSSLVRWSKNGKMPRRRIDPGGRSSGWLMSEIHDALARLERKRGT